MAKDEDVRPALECPICGCPQSRVYKTRKRLVMMNGKLQGGIRRERICVVCGLKFVTNETVR